MHEAGGVVSTLPSGPTVVPDASGDLGELASSPVCVSPPELDPEDPELVDPLEPLEPEPELDADPEDDPELAFELPPLLELSPVGWPVESVPLPHAARAAARARVPISLDCRCRPKPYRRDNIYLNSR